MKIARALALLFAILIGAAGLITLALHKKGYFNDPQVALRELDKLGIPPTAQSVHRAAAKGNLLTLSTLARAGADFQATDEYGRTPLHLALANRHGGLLHLLEEQGCDLLVPDNLGNTPLSIALDNQLVPTARTLLHKGVSPDFIVPSGEAALAHYYHTRRNEDFDLLLEQGADPDTRDNRDRSLLALSLQDSRPQLTLRLLDKGANPNGTISGHPLLASLIENWSLWGLTRDDTLTIATTLLAKGAAPEAPGPTGQSPLQIALANNFQPAADLLLPVTENVTSCLWPAIRNGHRPTLQTLFQKGLSPDEPHPETGITPLIHAIRHGDIALLNTVLSAGADPDQLAPGGQRALFFALATQQTNCALAMLNHQNQPDLEAVMESPVSEEYIELFGGKKHGQYYWYCHNETGLTLLMSAVMLGNIEVAQRLLELGVDKFQGTDSPGVVYPIQMAAVNKDVPMQQLLLGVSHLDEDQQRNFVIDLSEQKVRYYKNGELVKTSRISSGRSGFRTPTGHFVITDKNRHHKSNIYNSAPMPYFQRFSCSAVGFHEGYTGSRFASHGCIRLPRSTAQFFWKETSIGDRVTIQK